MITLLPDYRPFNRVGYPESQPLESAPNYVRSRGSHYWHRARSGCRHHDGRISYSYWCGPNYGDFGQEEIGDDEPLCGTCEGRFTAQAEENRWRFEPVKARRPRMCPAGRSERLTPPGAEGVFSCPVCGETVWGRAVSRWYSGWAVIRHVAGPGLVEPCRRHGWRELCLDADGRAVCVCTLRVGGAA